MKLEIALKSAEFNNKCFPDKRFAIYRVGNQWMSTASTEAEVQAKYKVKIQQYQVLNEGAPTFYIHPFKA